MGAKTYGGLTSLVVWPACACVSILLLAGGLPSAIEKPFILVLWGLAALLVLSVLAVAVTPLLCSLDEMKAPPVTGLDRIIFYFVNPFRLVLIVALFLAGEPILGGCFLVGFLCLWTLTARNRRHMSPADE